MRRSAVTSYLVLAFLSVCVDVADGGKVLNIKQDAFRRNVVGHADEVRWLEDLRFGSPSSFNAADLEEILVEKAIPVEEYEARLRAAGGPQSLKTDKTQKQGSHVPDFMRLETQENTERWQRRLEDDKNNDDDYVMDNGDMYDFAGYSLKYATCQKIARFSSEAVLNGEYSALVTDDIVFLRLCPKRHCSSDKQWGCTSGYGEYALELRDYLYIMLHYKVQKEEALCGFCSALSNYCSGSWRERVLEDAYNDDGGNADDQYAYDDDDNGNGSDNDGNSPCEIYSDTCSNIQNKGSCGYGDDDDGNDLDILEYINYIDCVEVNGMYVGPRCDAQSTKIKMGIFSDPYCSQYAGNEYNLNEFSGVNFNNDDFEDFYSEECIDCAKSYEPPYYNIQSNLCNKVYQESGQCNTYLAVSVNDDDAYDKSSHSDAVCSLIDSVQFGSFDSNGDIITSESQYGSEVRGEVTPSQALGLALSCLICGSLAIYSCYLHHSITNVLLKSLSHGPLVSSDKSAHSKKVRRSHRDEGNDLDY